MLEPTVLVLGANLEDVVKILAVAGGLGVAIVWIIFSSVRSMVVAKEREETRREVAAYVAEGSMTPDDAAKLIEAGRRHDKAKSGCWS